MSRRIIYRLFRPVFWLHEILHLLPARAFGIQARLDANYEAVIFSDLSAYHPLKAGLTLLTPALVGLLALIGAAWAWNLAAQTGLGWRGHLNWLCAVWICFGWLCGCVDDLWQVWHYGRCRRWRERTANDDQ